jgi:Fur family ferric uptake transcriptional regulator
VSDWAAEADARLRERGHRGGAARSAVIAYLAAQGCCNGAQEIHDALRARGLRVGLATVYRVLDTLSEHGLVQRVDVGDGVARYEPVRRDDGHHHHLVCDDCGKVEAFEDAGLEQAIRRVEASSGYAVAAHDVVLRGACTDCRYGAT